MSDGAIIDVDAYERDGYTVLSGAVPPSLCIDLVEAMNEVLDCSTHHHLDGIKSDLDWGQVGF
jgi:hypothetical protein